MRLPLTQRRPFTNRPFWRDWVLGGVLFGTGWMCYRLNRPVAYVLVVLGAGVLLAAIVHAVGTPLRGWAEK